MPLKYPKVSQGILSHPGFCVENILRKTKDHNLIYDELCSTQAPLASSDFIFISSKHIYQSTVIWPKFFGISYKYQQNWNDNSPQTSL